MRASVAVRLDIRPRLRLAPDWQPGPAAPRRFRLPPLALPAAGYWAAMAALTYAFAQLGPNPLDKAYASEPPPSPAPAQAPPEPSAEPPLVAAATPSAAPALTEPPTALTPEDAEPRPAPPRSRTVVDPPLGTEEPAPAALGLPVTPPSAALSFPEFTDGAPARPRERAADGPRLESLFERADSSPPPAPEQAPSDAPTERAPSRPVALMSCEAAIARNDERLEIGGPRGPADITREAYASILQNGGYLSGCGVPDRTVLEICAAVKEGRAVGVTVASSPPNAELGACVRRAVARLHFPHSDRLDVTHTRFDSARR